MPRIKFPSRKNLTNSFWILILVVSIPGLTYITMDLLGIQGLIPLEQLSKIYILVLISVITLSLLLEVLVSRLLFVKNFVIQLIFYALLGIILAFIVVNIYTASYYGNFTYQIITSGLSKQKLPHDSPAIILSLLVCTFFIWPILLSILPAVSFKQKVAKFERVKSFVKTFLKRVLLSLVSIFFLFGVLYCLTVITKNYIKPYKVEFPQDFSYLSNKTSLASENASIILAESFQPFLRCLDNKSLLQYLIGDTVLFLPSKPIILNTQKCFAVVLPESKITSDPQVFQENLAVMPSVGEQLVRAKYQKFLKEKTYVNPSTKLTFVPKDNETLQLRDAAGIYLPGTQKILVNDSSFLMLHVIIHEVIHAFADVNYTWNSAQGLNEGITQYLTEEITKSSSVHISDTAIYSKETFIVEYLMTHLDRDSILENFFNRDFPNLAKQIDSQTYPGFLCNVINTFSLQQPAEETRVVALTPDEKKEITSKLDDIFNDVKPDQTVFYLGYRCVILD